MKQFKYANLAKADLIDIAAYTSRMWGEVQTGLYIDQLEDCCQRLAQDPGIGRLWTPRRPGLRRMEQGRHVIFYQQQDSGILVYRILHRSMLPSRQSFDETWTGAASSTKR